MKVYAVTMLALFALVGCYPMGGVQPAPPDFVTKAYRDSTLIAAASEIAITNAGRPDIRRFAATSIVVHRDVIHSLARPAAPLTVALAPPQLTTAEHRALEQLRAISGPEFDDAYLDLLRRTYERAVSDYSAFLNSPDAHPPLADFAEATLRRLNDHLSHIRGFSAPLIG